MRESYLGKLYYNLSDDDRKNLRRLLPFPAFNQRPEVLLLFEFLEKHAAENPRNRRKKQAPLEKEAAYHFVFSQKNTRAAGPYNDGKMRHLMSYALEAIRQYLAWDDWRQEPANAALHLCRALKKRSLDAQFDKDHPRALAEIEAAPHRSDAYFFQRYALELEAWELYRAGQRSGEGNLAAVSNNFAVHVAINTLRQACAALAQKTVAEKNPSIPYLRETLALVEQGQFAGIPAVETYYSSYKALAEPDNDLIFNTLKQNVEQWGALFPDAERRDLYILAINFCIRRLNAGERRYIREGFELYRAGLSSQVFLENGYLSRYTYRNILNLALALSEWDWALEYLHTFAPYLPPKERDNIFRYNLATFYFRRPDPEKALELLRYVEFRDVLYNFDARRMLLRIYYDRREWMALESLLDSFSAYLQRHRDGSYHYEMYHNLVRFTKRLIHLRAGDMAAQTRLLLDIEKSVHVAEREWLRSVLGYAGAAADNKELRTHADEPPA